MIHVYGDSHSWMFRGYRESSVQHLGGITAHRIGRDGFTFPVPRPSPDDICIFVFGEIDVRCHILRIANEFHLDTFDVILELAARYTDAIATFQNTHRIKAVIASILPPSGQGHENSLPVFGSLPARAMVTIALNQMLEFHAGLRQIKFLDYWWFFALPDGTLNHEMSDGLVHIATDHYQHVHRIADHQLFSTYSKTDFPISDPD